MASKKSSKKPKSPLDDFGKWLASQAGEKISAQDMKIIKRYARGIGWSGPFEKRLEPLVNKAMRANNNPAKKLAEHKYNMYLNKQDKYARAYGDSAGPFERFFDDMKKGRAPRKEFNKRANAAWNAETEIGRRQFRATESATRKALTPQPPKAVRTRAKKAVKKAAPRKAPKKR